MNHSAPSRACGFSIVELMVSVVISLLALTFATRMIVGAEQSKQASLGGSDSMQNGMIAMFSIKSDVAQSGWGLNEPLVVGCNTVFSDTSGYVLASAARGGATVTPMAAAVIVSNGAAPDQLTVYAGSSMSGVGTLRVTTTYTAGARIDVDRVPYGFSQGDVILVAPETLGASDCALAQISDNAATHAAPPAQQYIMVSAGGANRFNTGNLGVGYTGSQARLFNLGPAGQLSFHTWSVLSGALQLRATNLAGASAAPATVVDNIVSLKAQYGFDTRVGAAFTPHTGMQVASWSGTMVDADGDGVVGGAGDYQRVAAVRLAVVARSKAPERPGPRAACSATTVLPTVFSSAEPTGVAAVPVQVTVAVTGDTVDWKCYRYRVFENIVPVRNLGWRPS